MFIGTWIVVGLVTGFVASKFVIKADDGLLMDVGLGIAGAVIGGWLFRALITTEATSLSVSGLLIALAGAGAALVVYHRLFPRTPPAKPVRRAGARAR
jgi:uncharacterized membrane protein YeaQ/YmgE (transglycosylase-associated protein family)